MTGQMNVWHRLPGLSLRLIHLPCNAFKTHPSIAVSLACYNYPQPFAKNPKLTSATKVADTLRVPALLRNTLYYLPKSTAPDLEVRRSSFDERCDRRSMPYQIQTAEGGHPTTGKSPNGGELELVAG